MKEEIKEGQVVLGNLLMYNRAYLTTSFGVYTTKGIYPIYPVNPSCVDRLLRKIMTLRELGKYFTYDRKLLPSYISDNLFISCMLKAFPVIPDKDICGFLLRELQHTPESILRDNVRSIADLFEIVVI